MASTFLTQNDDHVVARDLSTDTLSEETSATNGNKRVRDDADETNEGGDMPSSKRQKTSENFSANNSKKRARESTDEALGEDDASPAKRRKTTPDTVSVSSQPLGFTTETVLSNKVTKIGKARLWVFQYESAAGVGLYVFMKCPAAGCKHKFSEHPLEHGGAVNHFNECQVQVDSEKHMVKEYASQVVKDPNRKSDLTLEWAAMSNASTQKPKPSPVQQEPVALRRSSRKRAPPARYAFPNTTAFVGDGKPIEVTVVENFEA